MGIAKKNVESDFFSVILGLTPKYPVVGQKALWSVPGKKCLDFLGAF
jgi:hypothetical protein